ncbi:hypothetical protein RINTHH_9500 [Richelia intracellularis HH01]|uniref:Uncharacterized protein n=1 Tax=Richelia intracellularis HH01 TaxID=1165094 RepID=M1X2M9_9NOST|nr:hypothetical protein [Richelia intracellularis]CCH67105.1 hypothetical protein RINTHH_9500 [Richelia intracellularis HH01]HAE05819.1 hypothetical protein [Richelia sp.]
MVRFPNLDFILALPVHENTSLEVLILDEVLIELICTVRLLCTSQPEHYSNVISNSLQQFLAFGQSLQNILFLRYIA